MDYLNKLNPEQKKAAMHNKGPLLILAGAGSGKTSTMTHRIAYLIREEGVAPYNILAVTFTNKAAGEMRERVESLIGSSGNMWILTFHSACLRILRKYAERLNYDSDFVVYDPTDQKVVVKACLKEHNLDDKKYTPNYVLSIISDCKEKNMTPNQYIDSAVSPAAKSVGQVYASYEKQLRKNNAMDFDDLILNTVRLFEQDEEVLLHYQERFKYIMVDEYQDTNYIQYRFVKMLAEAHQNICVVGDDDQCIYQWRGADIKNILDFEKDFKGTKVIKLEQNYRSHANILEGAHSIISKNKGRKSKKLWTDKDSGEKIQFFSAGDEKEEARFVAQEISKLQGSRYAYNDFAILYRTNAQSRTFEEALSAFEIPYRVLGGVRYYDRKEIKDMMAYMRLVQNPADDLSFRRIVNEPKRGIGEKTIEKLTALAEMRGVSLLELMMDEDVQDGLSAKSAAGVKIMVNAIKEISAEKENLRVSDIYDGLMVRTGYLKALEDQNTVEAEGRIENLLEFKSVIFNYEKDDPQLSLSEFMEKIALLAEIDNHNADENAVVLMTLHSAKGLEFPVVFMPGMEDGLFPGWRSMERPEGLEEERRLCYVGMTRAMERLYLIRAQMRTLYGKTDYTRESSFLRELDKKYLEGEVFAQKETDGFARAKRSGNDGYAAGQIFRPFDQLKYIKEAVSQGKGRGDGAVYDNGDKVSHKKFGEGVVLEADDKTIVVMFDSVGRKKLAKGMAPLEKI